MSYYRNLILSGGYYWDADAVAFINATGITNITIKRAVNGYVIGLKNKGIWGSIVALYPFVGGNATAHRYSLYFNTTVVPSANIGFQSETLFLYSRTSGQQSGQDIGAANTITQRDSLTIRNASDLAITEINTTTNGTLSVANTSGLGLFMASRIASNDLTIYKNGISLGTLTSINSGARSTLALYVGGRNLSNAINSPVARNFALAGCGLRFTAQQASDFYTLTQTFQTSLGRQV